MKLVKACDYPIRDLLGLSNTALTEIFPAHTTIDNDLFIELMCYFEKINHARNHPGFTFLYHYQEYREQVKESYSYTQFMEHFNRKYAKIRGSMKLEHEPGKEIFIDFAGKKLHLTDKETGELIPVEVL